MLNIYKRVFLYCKSYDIIKKEKDVNCDVKMLLVWSASTQILMISLHITVMIYLKLLYKHSETQNTYCFNQ